LGSDRTGRPQLRGAGGGGHRRHRRTQFLPGKASHHQPWANGSCTTCGARSIITSTACRWPSTTRKDRRPHRRVTSDIEAVQSFITTALWASDQRPHSAGIVGSCLPELAFHAHLALHCALAVPGVYFFTRRIKKASRDVRKKQSELLSLVEEVLSSGPRCQGLCPRDYEERRFERQSLENVETPWLLEASR